jgi:quercetin dioxygenase-like cupin family protein
MTGTPIARHLRDIAEEADEVWHPGAQWKVLFSADATPTEALTCGVVEVAAGAPLRLHRHAHPEVYYVLEGEAVVVVDAREWPLTPGAAHFLPGNAEHGVRVRTGTARLFFVFAADGLGDIEYVFAPESPKEDGAGPASAGRKTYALRSHGEGGPPIRAASASAVSDRRIPAAEVVDGCDYLTGGRPSAAARRNLILLFALADIKSAEAVMQEERNTRAGYRAPSSSLVVTGASSGKYRDGSG